MMLLSYLTVLVCSAQVALSLNTVVNLEYSSYRGTVEDGISKWRGIRFAAPPLGDRRFRAPQPPLSNTTLQDASRYGPLCIGTGQNASNPNLSEDCLTLNVYAPQEATETSRLPVFVFIQGGGFALNGNPNYDGSGLIRAGDRKMVIVNFNYRVGLFGFLASREVVGNGSANAGLLDQRAVFQWVQKYITMFGGDPNHVTIGGCSAGGGSVTLHQTAYGGRNDNLFHAVAAESSSFHAQQTIQEAQYQYDFVVAQTRCRGQYDTLSCLRRLPLATLQPANTIIPYPGGSAQPPIFMWSNVIDGTFTTDYMYRLLRLDQYIKVPSIYGATTNEGTLFAPRNMTGNYAQMNDFLRANFPTLTDQQLQTVDSLYPRAEQFPNTDPYWRTTANAYGELRYNCPGIYASNVIAGGTPGSGPAAAGSSTSPPSSKSWSYRYNVLDPQNAVTGLGTTHVEEVGAIFGPQYVGGWAPGSYNTTVNSGIVPIVQGYWASFIRAYDPSVYRARGTPEWRPFDPSSFNRIMLNTTGTAMETVPASQLRTCRYWWSIGESIQQ